MRFFTYRFGGTRQWLGPISGLSYTFTFGGVTPVADDRDAEVFLRMGTPDGGTYFFREVDAAGTPVGPFPPVDPANRVSMIDPKKFPSDQIGVGVQEWRELTEDLADPFLYYHYSRKKLFP